MAALLDFAGFATDEQPDARALALRSPLKEVSRAAQIPPVVPSLVPVPVTIPLQRQHVMLDCVASASIVRLTAQSVTDESMS